MNRISTALRLQAGLAGVAHMRDRLPFLRWRSELGKLLLTASPIVLIGLLGMAMSIADIVMLGRYDAEGLAAVVVISDLYSIILNFSAGFAGVVTPQVAAAIGARVRWHVCTIVRRTLLLALLPGALGAAIILLFPHILAAAGAKQAEAAGSYVVFMAGTYLFMLLFALVRAVLSAMGRPRFALLAIIAALPLKVAANYALIYGAWGMPELGVAGAGLASFIATALIGGWLTLYLFVSPSFAEFDDPEPAPPSLAELWQLARSGMLMGLTAVSETGVFLASTIVVGLFAPQDLIAHALAFRAMAICYLFVLGIGQAITIRMAFLYARAARNLEVHARRAITSCCIGLIGLVLMLFLAGGERLARVLAATVESEADLPASIAALLPIAGLTLAALVPAHLLTAMLRARDDVVVPTGFTAVSYWGMALAAMLPLAAAGLGARAVWLSLLLGASVCSACLAAYVWKEGNAGSRWRPSTALPSEV